MASPLALADRVESIRADGSLDLASGDHVVLAGIELSPEAHRILPILVAEKDVKINLDPYIKKLNLGGPMAVYLFLELHEMNLPYDPASTPNKTKSMLNKVLITMGAATVRENVHFRYKEEFMGLQMEAQIRGQGIWSYEAMFGSDGPAEEDPMKRLNARLALWDKSEDGTRPETENPNLQDEWPEL